MSYVPPADPGAWLVPPAQTPALPVVGRNGRFAVRRIWCVGRNYAAHAREMGGDDREPPFFFAKPADALVVAPDNIPYPPATCNLHHEAELVIAVGQNGRDWDLQTAQAAIFGYAVGLDLTRRDLQQEAKNAGKPWDMAKGFDHSAVCTPIVPVQQAEGVADAHIWLTVGGVERQRAKVSDMIWNCAEILMHLSTLVELRAGDLIYTGTPEGVGPLVAGDVVEAGVTGLPVLRCQIVTA